MPIGADALRGRARSIGKAILGLVASAFLALNYAWAFAYTPFACAAGLGCFSLLSLPLWLNWLGRPVRTLFAYYFGVVLLLFLAAIGRFVVEALLNANPAG